MDGLTRSTRISIFSNIQHYTVYVSTIGSCMPYRRLRQLDVPLLNIVTTQGFSPVGPLACYMLLFLPHACSFVLLMLLWNAGHLWVLRLHSGMYGIEHSISRICGFIFSEQGYSEVDI